MTGDAVVQEVGGHRQVSWWQVLRVVLVVGWAAWAGLTWWTTPREASAADARADLAAGHVTSYEWGGRWQNTSGLFVHFDANLQSSGMLGPIFLWHTDDGRAHYAVLDGDAPVPTTSAPAETEYSGPEAAALGADLRAWQDNGSAVEPATRTILAGLGIAGALLILWALVSAPDPATGTRWFWFWLISGVPFGLGLLWWLARERPWSYRARPRAKPLRWYAGIGFAILGGLLLSLVVLGLHSVLGDALVPSVG